ncbi:hypothetical protein PFISCL1PPCAC_14609, partial [Pristionchus fissidentatus]
AAAIGMSLVLCTQTYTILSFMFLFRYAKVRSPSLLGSLSNRSIILKVCLSLSISSLFFFSLPAFFFRPNSIAVDLIADYVRKVFNQGRDYAFQMSVVCYWFCLNFVFIILNRVGWTTLPLLMNINYTQPLNRIF